MTESQKDDGWIMDLAVFTFAILSILFLGAKCRVIDQDQVNHTPINSDDYLTMMKATEDMFMQMAADTFTRQAQDLLLTSMLDCIHRHNSMDRRLNEAGDNMDIIWGAVLDCHMGKVLSMFNSQDPTMMKGSRIRTRGMTTASGNICCCSSPEEFQTSAKLSDRCRLFEQDRQ
jgi:hypothetical protein